MIRVGSIKSLSIHFQKSIFQPEQRLYVDMKNIRLNHYIMRTKEDAVQSARKWNKSRSRHGQITSNPWFRIVFDDSILDSKRLI
jgi:predicted metalloenzyme YecM